MVHKIYIIEIDFKTPICGIVTLSIAIKNMKKIPGQLDQPGISKVPRTYSLKQSFFALSNVKFD